MGVRNIWTYLHRKDHHITQSQFLITLNPNSFFYFGERTLIQLGLYIFHKEKLEIAAKFPEIPPCVFWVFWR